MGTSSGENYLMFKVLGANLANDKQRRAVAIEFYQAKAQASCQGSERALHLHKLSLAGTGSSPRMAQCQHGTWCCKPCLL